MKNFITNKHIAALLTLGSLTGISILHYEAQLDITTRYENGNIVNDVKYIQGGNRLDPSHANYKIWKASFDRRVERNMASLKGHVDQVKCANGNITGEASLLRFCPERAEW